MPTRSASHAGSWYSADPRKLASELDSWLDGVPAVVPCIRSGKDVTSDGTNAGTSVVAERKKKIIVDELRKTETKNVPVTGARLIIAP